MDPTIALRGLASLAVIATLLAGLRYLSRMPFARLVSRLPAGRDRRMRVLESLALPGASSLHLVAISDRCFVIGQSAAQVSLLCELGVTAAVHARSHRG